MTTSQSPPPDVDAFLSFQEAASALGLPYFKVQRAARQGLIPTYSLLNARKYVKLRDIFDKMSAAQN